MGGVTLGMREAVIVLIALVALYMVFVLLRMRHLRGVAEQKLEKAGVAAKPAESFEEDEPESPPPAPAAEAWQSPPVRLADTALQQGLEQEVSQLREELDSIRGELAALREDMLSELAHLRATQSVSPIYGDAMQMAAAGYEPAMIADRCGIARAEAELVVALAKSQER
jgi:hypothetical protein